MIEYICLTCGAQGLVETNRQESKIPTSESGGILRCPKCGAGAFFLKRKAASDIQPLAQAKTT